MKKLNEGKQMRFVRYILKLIVVVTAMAALYVGLLRGEWGETMFNGALL